MKILLLNPHIDASHPLVQELRALGIHALVPQDSPWQVLQLHGKTVQLAVIHREGAGHEKGAGSDPGLQLVRQIKTDPEQSDLPYILTSETWTDAEFSQHQDTPEGANAYLQWPCTSTQIAELAGEILGQPVNRGEGLAPAPIPELAVHLESPEIEAAHPLSDLHPANDAHFGSISLALPPEAAIETPVASLPETNSPPEPDLPHYLQDSAPPRQVSHAEPSAFFNEPVLPGGAGADPDRETLKKYLLLREQDVQALAAKLRASEKQMDSLSQSLRAEKALVSELTHTLNEQKRRIDHFDVEKRSDHERLDTEIRELQFQLKTKTDKARVLENRVTEAQAEIERIKDRVRVDIRKIRVREKELENRLEILKKDSEALLSARETKIVELKRKLDLLEFNMDLVQDQYAREKEASSQLRDKLNRAAQAMRVAGGLLDQPKAGSESESATPQPQGDSKTEQAS